MSMYRQHRACSGIYHFGIHHFGIYQNFQFGRGSEAETFDAPGDSSLNSGGLHNFDISST